MAEYRHTCSSLRKGLLETRLAQDTEKERNVS